MVRKAGAIVILVVFMLSVITGVSVAQERVTIKLPAPDMSGGKPLMQVLKARSSAREYAPEALSNQVLSNLLWAAFGINRPDSGKRTAPSAVNWQEVDIYVTTAEGCYRYMPKEHALLQVGTEDIRALTGTQDFVKDAPVNLVYVADLAKMGDRPREAKIPIAFADTGFIGQNVYLYCASAGLATVVRGLVDKENLAPAMKLRADQLITLAQSVGYPKK